MRLLVTGGLGFIGSNFIWKVAENKDWEVVNLDKQTYAGNPENLDPENDPAPPPRPQPIVHKRAQVSAEKAWDGRRYAWVKADICNEKVVDALMSKADAVVHLAAETHVDRSIISSSDFLKTNVLGTHVLLEAAKRHGVKRFVHVGTDEVYGSVEKGESKETDPLSPRSPYAASKAAGDLLALSFHTTYGLPVVVTRASNNFGRLQHPEKALPLLITNALDGKPYPLYGDGLQVRDWLYVEDHVAALLMLLDKGVPGEIYNVGGVHEVTNLELARKVLGIMEKPERLIQRVPDRPGHDRRYALNCDKLRELGWKPKRTFEEALLETVKFYTVRQDWWRAIKEGKDFRDFYKKQYAGRLK